MFFAITIIRPTTHIPSITNSVLAYLPSVRFRPTDPVLSRKEQKPERYETTRKSTPSPKQRLFKTKRDKENFRQSVLGFGWAGTTAIIQRDFSEPLCAKLHL